MFRGFSKVLAATLLVASVGFAKISNINFISYGDESTITGLSGTSATGYSSVYKFAEYDGITVAVLCNDTSAAGFGVDTVSISWGYQKGMLVKDSAGSLDTAWGAQVRVDSLNEAFFGATLTGTLDSADNGFIELVDRHQLDTGIVTGYAAQVRELKAINENKAWRFFRLYFTCGTGNNANTAVAVKAYIGRRLTVPTHERN